MGLDACFEIGLVRAPNGSVEVGPLERVDFEHLEADFLGKSTEVQEPDIIDFMEVIMRIQMEIPEEDVRELKALMEKLGIDTYKDLFSNALTILYWAAQEIRDGQSIASVDPARKHFKELAMPTLNRLARHRKTELVGSLYGEAQAGGEFLVGGS